MRMLFTIFIAIIAFASGVWYMGGFDAVPNVPDTTAPTSTPSNGNGLPTTSPQLTYHNADANIIRVTTPQPGATVSSTFTVSGQARGNWYFEANFPLEVQDANGTTLVQSPVQAQGDWMTTEFVPFTVQVTVPNYTGEAVLILHNDNASGLPENARSVSIPITIQ